MIHRDRKMCELIQATRETRRWEMRDRKKQLTPSVDVSDEVMPSLIKSIEQVDGEWKKKSGKGRKSDTKKCFFFH